MNNSNREEVFQKVRYACMEALDIDSENITEESRIKENLGADSIDEVELAIEVEKIFDIIIPDSEIENFKTIGDVVDYIINLS